MYIWYTHVITRAHGEALNNSDVHIRDDDPYYPTLLLEEFKPPSSFCVQSR